MIQRIDSVLFYRLLSHVPNEMDFTLVALYCTLKKRRNKVHSYQPHDKLRGYKLLQHHTNISSFVLRKKIPLLIEMGLCHFLDNGGFFMLGNEKTKSGNKKVVPIRIFDKISNTKTAVKYVIEKSNLDSQKRISIKKKGQSELLKASDNNSIRNLRQLKQLRRLHKNGISCQSDVNYVKTINLSNRRIGELMGGDDCPHNQKSRGKYLKDKFSNMGLHKAKRRFKKISDKFYTYDQYLIARYDLREIYGNVTFIQNNIYTELSNSIEDISDDILSSNKETMKNTFKFTTSPNIKVVDPDGTLHPWLIQEQYLPNQKALAFSRVEKNQN